MDRRNDEQQDAGSMQESGVLLVDKQPDWTSHDVVQFLRRFGFKKVGHCGTLDPAATGVLVIVLGRATKLTDRFSAQDKTYTGCIEFGKETDSQDGEGTVTAEADWSGVTPEMVREAAAAFEGDQLQIPPMVSAVKIGGQKLYKLARQGITIEREPRPITIYSFALDRIEMPHAWFTVRCTKGTYIRTLASDVGNRVGCGAFLKTLRRTQSGRFSIEQAVSMEDIKTWDKRRVLEAMFPMEEVLTYV